MERVQTGIDGLDRMLNGGLIPKRPYVVVGPIGSGKTTLGVHFLLNGIQNEESVLLVALDEPPNEIKENMHSFGWDVSDIRILDATPDVKAYSKTHAVKELASKMDVSLLKEVKDIRKSSQQRTMEVSIYSVQQMLKQEMKEYHEVTGNAYSRLVIDSMTALKIFGMKGMDIRTALQSFFRFLSELEVTALIMIDSASLTDELETDLLLARGEIRLHRWREGDEQKRAISIEKMRGTPYDMHIRPFSITDKGIIVHSDSEIIEYGAEAEEAETPTEPEALTAAAVVEGKKMRKPKPRKKPTARKTAKKAPASRRRKSKLDELAEKTYKEYRTL